jgi:hypothetical protein
VFKFVHNCEIWILYKKFKLNQYGTAILLLIRSAKISRILFILYRRFVRMFMSGHLLFPSDPREHRFGVEDLRDLGEIGAGRFGRVNKMMHLPTGREMAVKVK